VASFLVAPRVAAVIWAAGLRLVFFWFRLHVPDLSQRGSDFVKHFLLIVPPTRQLYCFRDAQTPGRDDYQLVERPEDKPDK
jgi:hypothetical protein